MGDDVQMIDASSGPCFQPVIDCEPFDIANEGEVGVENHEEGNLGLNLYINGSDKMHIIDNGEMHDGQECVDLGVVPFEYNEGKTRDGERCEDFEECSEETIIGKVFGGQEEAYEFYNRYALVKGFAWEVIKMSQGYKNRLWGDDADYTVEEAWHVGRGKV
ncbi:hypothetical protein RJ640_020122 [Escallonia rubra]|uniref:Uncharacterized protein n=1 Tax=Escallonia rubra TaxID=112253 RepID=A0AA88RUM6_9ASTE|nr:hypothetical protein RJ640_020122 [Escallonia rubra]